MEQNPAPAPPSAGPPWSLVMTAALFAMIFVAVGMAVILGTQIRTYQGLIRLFDQNSDGGLVIAVTRAFDAAIVKTCSIFLGFLLVFLGGVYTLRIGDTLYKLSVQGASTKGTLESASPGLVMVSLGCVLISLTILKTQTVNYSRDSPPIADISAATEPGRAGRVETVLGNPAVGQKFTDNDVRALNSALILLASHATAFPPDEQSEWEASRGRIDAIRKELALSRYPAIAEQYGRIAKEVAVDPSAVDRLPTDVRQQFLTVQRLLGQRATAQ